MVVDEAVLEKVESFIQTKESTNYINLGLKDISINPDMSIQVSGEIFNPTELSMNQLHDILGIPLSFNKRLEKWDIEAWSNLNKSLQNARNIPIRLATNEKSFIGVTSQTKPLITNRQFIQQIVQNLNEENFEIKGFSSNLNHCQIEVFRKNSDFSVGKTFEDFKIDDIYKIGYSFGHSSIGYRQTSGHVSLLRQFCLNGAHLTEKIYRIIPQISDPNPVAKLIPLLNQSQDDTFKNLIRSNISKLKDIKMSIRELEEGEWILKHHKIELPEDKIPLKKLKEKSNSEKKSSKYKSTIITPIDPYTYLNVFTALANTLPELSFGLRIYGGRMLTRKTWDSLDVAPSVDWN